MRPWGRGNHRRLQTGGVAGDTGGRSSAEEGFEASGGEKWGLWINQPVVGNAGKYGSV